MNLFSRTFRLWWQKPRKAEDRPEHRQVTFLELFYDLVYVALIAQLAHAFAADITWSGLGQYLFLFLAVWWSWINGTLYHDLHGNNDIRTRGFTFLQMFFVVGMAIFAHNAIGEGSVGFALSFAGFQLTLTILWWRTGVHDKHHRPLSRPYSLIFLLNTALFVASVFINPPWRFYIWGIALGISLLLPLMMFLIRNLNEEARTQVDRLSSASPSLVERFGLFIIIVLGEVVVGVVSGATHHHMDVNLGFTAFLGTLLAIGIWWLYFDFISHKIPRKGMKAFSIWFYLHLPLTMGIAAVGASLVNIIEHPGTQIAGNERQLITISLAIVVTCIAFLGQVIQQHDFSRRFYRVGTISMILTAVAFILLALISTGPVVILAISIFLLLIPVGLGLISWIRHHDHAGTRETKD